MLEAFSPLHFNMEDV